MNALRRRLGRPPRPLDNRPFCDPWRGTNPVFLYELRVMRNSIRQRQRGLLNAIAGWIGRLVLIGGGSVGLYLLVQWIVTAPDPRLALGLVAAFTFGGLWLLQQWQVMGTMGIMSINYAASAITRERERGTWELLRISGLGMARILLGKYLAGLEAMPFVRLAIVAYVGVEVTALAVLVAVQDTLLAPGDLVPPVAWLAIFAGALVGVPQFFAAYACGTALAIAISAWMRSSGAAIAVSSALGVVTHFILPALLAFVFLLGSLTRWQPTSGRDLPYMLVFTYPLGITAMYALATPVLLRLALWGADRGE